MITTAGHTIGQEIEEVIDGHKMLLDRKKNNVWILKCDAKTLKRLNIQIACSDTSFKFVKKLSGSSYAA